MPGRKDLGPRDHQRSLACLCAVCGRKKPDLRRVTDQTAERLRVHALPDYSLSSGRHPTAICATCRCTLTAFVKVFK